MGHTNSTANLSLPQFISTDKPTWLGDVNGAFSAIDSYAGTNDAAVAGAVSDASSAIAQAASAVSTANAANTTAGNASTAATNAVGTANNAMSLVNQTNTKIGTLANLTTTDKTSIVNAINEVNAGLGGSTTAAQVSYDNSGSGLTATDVQAAIDELAQGGGGGATLLGSVTSDGVKTRAQLLEDLETAVSGEDLKGAYLVSDNDVFQINNVSTGEFSRASVFTNTATVSSIILSAHTWQVMNIAAGGTNTFSDVSSNVPTSGKTYSIYR